jgi:hypothetical protein
MISSRGARKHLAQSVQDAHSAANGMAGGVIGQPMGIHAREEDEQLAKGGSTAGG